MPETMFRDLAALCRSLESTAKRKEKTAFISEFLRKLEPEEVAPAILLIIGAVFPEFDPRSLDVGWKTVRKVLAGGGQTTLFMQGLTIKHVHKTLADIAERTGSGSRKVKEQLLEGLFTSADQKEKDILIRIIFGEMRIGVSEGVMLDAIAEASETPLDSVRRALMMTGDIGKVAEVALTQGLDGLQELKATLFVPLKPMLANMAEDAEEAILEHGGETAFEYKYDGARIQIHRRDGEVRVFSRRLSDVTASIPDIVKLVQDRIPGGDMVLEGEVVATGMNGKPLPFQDLMRRFTRVKDVEETARKIPLRLYLFDILYLGERLLIDGPYSRRWETLTGFVPGELLVDRIVTSNPKEAESFFEKAIEEGHEGLMAKRLDSTYSPGSRGKAWYKIKPAETLDVVVAAADWGSGRRRGWLSNYHLAVRNGEEYLVIGKTFKGLTDAEFDWMTEKLKSLNESETRYTVHVRPELVVEVAFNEVQRSPQYRSGFALRFARVTRIREDKGPEEADTLERVRELYERQFRYKARMEL
ncbi:MAG: ATP-dependent DNA ligase [Candidatus Bathyarchaeota archaeon]|nr:ATP-dependent DNA ligase [Candidatus Bathyarchaeota archaeon]